MKKTLLLAGILLSSLSMAQNISFLYDGLRKALVAKGYDTNHDGEISQSEADAITDMDVSNYNPSVANDQLTDVRYFDLRHFKNLETLTLDNINSLKIVNIAGGYNPKLKKVSISSRNLESFSVSNAPNLTYFQVAGSSKLEDVIFFNLPKLESLEISSEYYGSSNGMHSYINNDFDDPVDLSQFPKLRFVRIAGTLVEKIKVDNPNLVYLYLYDNHIRAMDITKAPKLVFFEAYNNQLKVLNLANGNNTNTDSDKLKMVDVRVNSALSCIQVDKGFYPGTTWQKDKTASFDGTKSSCACEHPLYIPDTDFEKYLLGKKDEDSNGILCQKEADKITYIDLANNYKNTPTLEGIEYLKNLETFGIEKNSELWEIDLSSNTNLKSVKIGFSDYQKNSYGYLNDYISLRKVNLRNLTKLESVIIVNSPFLEEGGTSAEGNYNTENLLNTSATNYPELEEFYIGIKKAEFSKIDFSKLPKLKSLLISSQDKSFTTHQHNLKKAKNIEGLSLFNTSIKDPDLVKKMSKLMRLYIRYNDQLSTLDVSQNAKLKDLTIEDTFITSMDLSHNKDLGKEYATFSGNQAGKVILKNNRLSSLNLANGVNYQLTNLDITGNSSLTCVKIDNGFTPPATWKRDNQTAFSTNCGMAVNDVVTQEAFSLYPNPVQDQLYIRTDKNVESVTVYDLNGRRVISQKGAAQINMSALMPGTYIVQILADGKVTSKKVIKK